MKIPFHFVLNNTDFFFSECYIFSPPLSLFLSLILETFPSLTSRQPLQQQSILQTLKKRMQCIAVAFLLKGVKGGILKSVFCHTLIFSTTPHSGTFLHFSFLLRVKKLSLFRTSCSAITSASPWEEKWATP